MTSRTAVIVLSTVALSTLLVCFSKYAAWKTNCKPTKSAPCPINNLNCRRTVPSSLLLKNFDGLSLTDIQDLYFEEVQRVHFKCGRQVRIGPPKADGSYDVCLDKGFELRKGCLVYSFGILNMWQFDEGMSMTYKCTVRSFDPTMGLKDHVHQPGNVNFYALGIGGKENEVKYLGGNKRGGGYFKTHNLRTILRRFKEEDKVIDILKMDVELSEWDALESMFRTGVLNMVKQLVLEFHTYDFGTHRRSSVDDYKRYLRVLQRLELIGFRKYKAETIGFCFPTFRESWEKYKNSVKSFMTRSACYEVNYLNMNYIIDK